MMLSIGATGSIGGPVIMHALADGYRVRALVRDRRHRLPEGIETIMGDLTRPETLAAAVAGIDSIVFTHGNSGNAEAVDYGGVLNERKLVMLQGDRRQSGTPSDGVIAHDQLAMVLVRSLRSDAAAFKTFELTATEGDEQRDTSPLDGARDMPNMPLDQEPQAIRNILTGSP